MASMYMMPNEEEEEEGLTGRVRVSTSNLGAYCCAYLGLECIVPSKKERIRRCVHFFFQTST